MKIPTILLAAALALAAAAPLSAANSYQLKMTAVNGKLSYAHSQKNEAGTQNDFAGKAEAKTEKKPDIVFKSLLKETKGGVPVLNYTFELAGEEAGLPVMRAASEVALVPGKKILAAVYGRGAPPSRATPAITSSARNSPAGRRYSRCGSPRLKAAAPRSPASRPRAVKNASCMFRCCQA